MGEYLTWEEIKSRYDSEWVLLDQPKKSPYQQVLGGILVGHCKDKNEIHEMAMALPLPRNIAVLYTGRVVPEGVEVVL